jgi:hypothetical protein
MAPSKLLPDLRYFSAVKHDWALDGSSYRAYFSGMTLHRSLLTPLLATAFSMQTFGQAPAPAPGAAPATATTPNPVIPFKNASFEEPVVGKRTDVIEGGNPTTVEANNWGHFVRRKGKGAGALNVGMTNEIARTGKQSIYLDFAAITGQRFTASLMTQLLPVKPGVPYKVGMWGRLDKARPLTLDQRRPYLAIEFEFYKQDEETQVSDTEARNMRIPGSLKKFLFTSSQWSQAYGIARVPAGATLMKVSYVFNVPNEAGETDGTIFFDDAFFDELPVDFPIEASDEIVIETDDETPEEAAATGGNPLKSAVPIK